MPGSVTLADSLDELQLSNQAAKRGEMAQRPYLWIVEAGAIVADGRMVRMSLITCRATCHFARWLADLRDALEGTRHIAALLLNRPGVVDTQPIHWPLVDIRAKFAPTCLRRYTAAHPKANEERFPPLQRPTATRFRRDWMKASRLPLPLRRSHPCAIAKRQTGDRVPLLPGSCDLKAPVGFSVCRDVPGTQVRHTESGNWP